MVIEGFGCGLVVVQSTLSRREVVIGVAGQARRSLGQKQGEWTVEMNDNMMRKMGAVGQASVP